jgi:hypothetical protein
LPGEPVSGASGAVGQEAAPVTEGAAVDRTCPVEAPDPSCRPEGDRTIQTTPAPPGEGTWTAWDERGNAGRTVASETNSTGTAPSDALDTCGAPTRVTPAVTATVATSPIATTTCTTRRPG